MTALTDKDTDATASHDPPQPPPINSTLTVGITADADATRRALNQFDLRDLAMRAIRALGVADHVVLTPGGLSWRRDAAAG